MQMHKDTSQLNLGPHQASYQAQDPYFDLGLKSLYSSKSPIANADNVKVIVLNKKAHELKMNSCRVFEEEH